MGSFYIQTICESKRNGLRKSVSRNAFHFISSVWITWLEAKDIWNRHSSTDELQICISNRFSWVRRFGCSGLKNVGCTEGFCWNCYWEVVSFLHHIPKQTFLLNQAYCNMLNEALTHFNGLTETGQSSHECPVIFGISSLFEKTRSLMQFSRIYWFSETYMQPLNDGREESFGLVKVFLLLKKRTFSETYMQPLNDGREESSGLGKVFLLLKKRTRAQFSTLASLLKRLVMSTNKAKSTFLVVVILTCSFLFCSFRFTK